MNKRLLCLGLLAAASQLFATGCHGYHPVIARFRANHPCVGCGAAAHPVLHPVQTRRAMLSEPVSVSGPVIGPVVPPCHGCGGSSGVPVGLSGAHFEGVPVAPTGYPPTGYPPTGYPPIGYPIGNPGTGSTSIGSPIPIMPGPVVIPSNPLPQPMPLPKQ